MDAVNSLIRQTLVSGDEVGRKKLLEELTNMVFQLESQQDVFQKIMYSNIELPTVHVGCETKLFETLAHSKTPLTVDQLAQKTGTAPVLMGRLCRYLASLRHIAEVDQDLFEANKTTHLLTNPGVVGGMFHHLKTFSPCLNAMPEFLKNKGYQNTQDFADTPLQVAHKTELPAMAWVVTLPEHAQAFSKWMTVQYSDLASWLDVYPIQQAIEAIQDDPKRVFFVDVGGGFGHQSIALRKTIGGTILNRIILQDQQQMIDHAQDAKDCAGVELMVADFWKPQTTEKARIYYMRQILHDYPDEKALVILGHLKAALDENSVILIDEIVIPNKGAHRHATQIDILLMSSLASLERTKDQWYALMEKAGLSINNIYKYGSTTEQCIIECVPMGRGSG